jgi:hypothetical protein
MSATITKHPHLGGLAMDTHLATPPITPPVPPSPAPLPWMWGVIIPPGVPVGELLLGKATTLNYSKMSFTGIGGDTLWQHDKGLAIPHIPMPTVTTPSIGLLLLGSSTKHFMPSFGVQEKTEVLGAVNIGQSGPIAISTIACFMQVQQCQDAGIGFVLPTGVVFCIPTTRFVGFTMGDVAAGFLGMAGDALAAAISSKLSGAFRGAGAALARRFAVGTIGRALGIGINRFGKAIGSPVIGAILGHVNNYLQNVEGAPENAGDRANRRIAADAGILTAPSGVGAAFGEMANGAGTPPAGQVGRSPNIWE